MGTQWNFVWGGIFCRIGVSILGWFTMQGKQKPIVTQRALMIHQRQHQQQHRPANSPTSAPSRPSIVFLFIGILLKMLFGYTSKINNEITDNECDEQLENMNVDCYFDFYDNGFVCPPHHPPPQIFLKFIGIIFHVFCYLNECEFDVW